MMDSNGEAQVREPALWSLLVVAGLIVVATAILGFASIGVYEVFFTANVTDRFHERELVDTIGLSREQAAQYDSQVGSVSMTTTGANSPIIADVSTSKVVLVASMLDELNKRIAANQKCTLNENQTQATCEDWKGRSITFSDKTRISMTTYGTNSANVIVLNGKRVLGEQK